MQPGLPKHCRSVLDIGCGVAGIDALLYAHYRADQPRIYLSDFQPMSPAIYYGYRLEAASYNSLTISRQLLTSNGVLDSQIEMVPPDRLTACLPKAGIDLVVSTLAWGFHFPVEEYLTQVDYVLTEEGRIILDIRSDTMGIQALAEKFHIKDILVDRNTYKRVVAQRY